MNKIFLIILLAGTAGFTACNLTGNVNPSQQQDIAYACATIAAAEDALATAPPEKWAAYRDQVRKAVETKKPVCNVKPEPKNLTDAAYKALQGAVTTFTNAKAAAQK